MNQIFNEVSDMHDLEEMQRVGLEIAPDNPDQADSIAQQLLKLSHDGQVRYKGMAYYILGEAEYYRERYNLALQHYMQAQPFLEQSGDSSVISGIYSNIALMYYYKANYTASLSYYEKSFALETLLNDSLGMAKTLQNMGLIFGNSQKYEMQQSYYMRAMELYKQMGDTRSEADIALNLGVSLIFQENFNQGYAYYLKALETYRELNDKGRIASVQTNIGYYYLKIKEYNKAFEPFNTAISVFKELDKKSGLINAYTGLGDLYAAKEQRDQAVKMYQICESINRDVGLLDLQRDNLLSLSTAYKEIGDVTNALRVYEHFNQIKDSIYKMNQSDKILELENRYKFEKSQNQVTELKAKNRLYLIFFLAAAFIVICTGVFLFFHWRGRRMKENQRVLRLEQKVLRTQMNPHFIFNSLSTIQYYILENKVTDAVDFLADFAGLMRMVLQYSQEEFIPLARECEILDYYINLQNKRFGDKVSYEIIVDPELREQKIMLPPMLAQPFIENSFEHGELSKKDNGHISVRFEKNGNKIIYVIEDNGIGIMHKQKENASAPTKKHKSLALKITSERLKLINFGKPGSGFDLKVQDRSQDGTCGTRVKLTIPLKIMRT
ncbi:tetratricopeptide repeat-containing sensor histidine kinase [Saccharicrinis carchari]|nr:tetratricopeptide repeat protein [Saccharicrinis carchari]